MAHPYSQQSRLEAMLGTDLVAGLLDRNHDGTPDAGVYSGALERASNLIDARLRQKYVVPFAAYNDPTPCDGMVSDLADYATAKILFAQDNPDSSDAKYWGAEFDTLVGGILTGRYKLNATEVTSAPGVGLRGFYTKDREPDTGLDSSGNDPLSRM